jgi:hypothetical protein
MFQILAQQRIFHLCLGHNLERMQPLSALDACNEVIQKLVACPVPAFFRHIQQYEKQLGRGALCYHFDSVYSSQLFQPSDGTFSGYTAFWATEPDFVKHEYEEAAFIECVRSYSQGVQFVLMVSIAVHAKNAKFNWATIQMSDQQKSEQMSYVLMMEPPGKTCAADQCEKHTKLKWCSGCNSALYCSREHQTEDWSRHKTVCARIKLANNTSLA